MTLLKHWRVLALIGLCAAGLALYALGRHDGKSQAAYDTVKATAEAYQKRAGTNEKINSLDPVALCVELGGVRDECEQLRGLAEDQR